MVIEEDHLASGSVVNQVFNEYDDFEQLAVQYQEHVGAVKVALEE